MQPHLNKSQGFTLIEVTLVIIVMGLLMAGLAPLLLRQHSGTMEARDATAMEDAKTAIINYAISYGGIPNPLNSTTRAVIGHSIATATVGQMPPGSGGDNPVPEFGVNNWGAYGSTSLLLLDINDNLKSSYINAVAGTVATALTATPTNNLNNKDGNRIVFCQSVNQQMRLSNVPKICQETAVTDHSVTVTSVCTPASSAAFVLYSTGANRSSNQENDVPTASYNATRTDGNRIYENDRRGIENSQGFYDDQVKSYPLTAFARDCREKMGVSAEVMSCAPGEKWVGSLTNTNPTYINGASYSLTKTVNAATGVIETVNGFTPPNGFTTYLNTCVQATGEMSVTMLTYGSPVIPSLPLNLIAMGAGDGNRDGRVDFVITATPTLTAQ